MKIRESTVGPLLGYTTDVQARVWLRGDLQLTSDGHGRAFGVAQVRQKGSKKFGATRYIPLHPHFDMTGVLVLTGLKAQTEYEYRAGWFLADTEMENLDDTQLLDWSDITPVEFRSGTTKSALPRSYVIGSCRYLLKLFGGSFWDERGDKIFRSILDQITSGRTVDACLMIGDQIYADDLKGLGQDASVDDYLLRYRTVFSQKYFRALTARVPTYMILDDHEIEDNWPTKASDKDWVTLYPAAIHAYQIYQCSHSPLFDVDNNGRITGTLNRFWYTFQDGCCDWFMMDCRNERIWSPDPAKRQMVSENQMKALLYWLGNGSGRAKMIVTSVPFFPDLKTEIEDKWGGFVRERTRILDFILDQKIRKVVFVSGDVHCSFSAELSSPQDPDFKIISVVSSSFFWPYPHMSESSFVLKGRLPSDSGNVYEVARASRVNSTDNFARLDVGEDGVSISYYERKGELLGKTIVRSF